MAIRTNGDTGYVGIPPLNVPAAPTFSSNNYTAVRADVDKFLRLSNGSTAGTFTVPLNASVPFPIGSQLNFTQSGAGQITLTPTVGVTINSSSGLKLRTTWSSATLVKLDTDTWVAFGDLSA